MSLASETTAPKPDKLRALTSIRFFAALFVVLYHTIFLVNPVFAGTIDYAHSSLFTRVISLGYVSVSFFFLLSGYILAWVYLRPSVDVPVRRFYVARFARVYPLFLITLLLDTPYLFLLRLSKYGSHEAIIKTVGTLGASTLMLQAWIPRLGGINFPSWSLSVEAFLYLIFPWLGAALWRLKTHQLWFAGVFIYAGGLAAVILTGNHLSAEAASRLPVFHAATFALGILLARWQFLKRLETGSSPESKPRVKLLASSTIVLGTGLVIAFMPWLPGPVLNDGLLSPLFACAVLLLSGSKGLLNRILGADFFVVLGEASFALYLIHIPLLHAYFWLGWDRIPALYPIYLLLCVGFSIASYYLLESPLRRWIHDRALGNKSTRTQFARQPQALEQL